VVAAGAAVAAVAAVAAGAAGAAVAAVAAGAAVAKGAAAVVLAEAGTEEEWDTAVAAVRVTAPALDLATPALGIRGTTLCQRGAPIRKTLPTKAEIITAEAFPATAARCTLWRNITRLTLRRHTRSCRLMTLSRERKKDLLMHFRPARSCRLTAAGH
jgi:hypothetical protein